MVLMVLLFVIFPSWNSKDSSLFAFLLFLIFCSFDVVSFFSYISLIYSIVRYFFARSQALLLDWCSDFQLLLLLNFIKLSLHECQSYQVITSNLLIFCHHSCHQICTLTHLFLFSSQSFVCSWINHHHS